MPRIFISYRRADTQNMADRIYDELGKAQGKENVFQDVGDIPFGIDFRKHIQSEIAKSDIVLVIIGKDWLEILHERKDNVDDYVRIEIELALKMNKLVIPVLVNGAEMPKVATLPESIRDFGYRNSIPIRPNPDFAGDVARLLEGLEKSLNYHNELVEVQDHQMVVSSPLTISLTKAVVEQAWKDAQTLIFENSQNAGDLIALLPNLMEFAYIYSISEDTLYFAVDKEQYKTKLQDQTCIKWVERSLSLILHRSIKVIYLDGIPF